MMLDINKQNAIIVTNLLVIKPSFCHVNNYLIRIILTT